MPPKGKPQKHEKSTKKILQPTTTGIDNTLFDELCSFIVLDQTDSTLPAPRQTRAKKLAKSASSSMLLIVLCFS